MVLSSRAWPSHFFIVPRGIFWFATPSMPKVCRSAFGLQRYSDNPAFSITLFTRDQAVVRHHGQISASIRASSARLAAMAWVASKRSSKSTSIGNSRKMPFCRRLRHSILIVPSAGSTCRGVRARTSDSRPPVWASVQQNERVKGSARFAASRNERHSAVVRYFRFPERSKSITKTGAYGRHSKAPDRATVDEQYSHSVQFG